jgi:hypothetical protein
MGEKARKILHRRPQVDSTGPPTTSLAVTNLDFFFPEQFNGAPRVLAQNGNSKSAKMPRLQEVDLNKTLAPL